MTGAPRRPDRASAPGVAFSIARGASFALMGYLAACSPAAPSPSTPAAENGALRATPAIPRGNAAVSSAHRAVDAADDPPPPRGTTESAPRGLGSQDSSELAAICADRCDLPPCRQGACGDGTRQAEEECDDGNLRNGDGCSERCTHEADDLLLTYGGVCIKTVAGTVKCWGRNDFGQLGLGDRRNRGEEPCTIPRYLPNLDFGTQRTVKSIGHSVPCVIIDRGAVKCWGRNGSQTIPYSPKQTPGWGDEPGEMGDTLPTIDLAGGEPALTLFGDTSTYCALFTGGRAKCWGTGAPSPATECGRNCVVFQRTTPAGFGDRLPFLNVAQGRKILDMVVARGLVCAALDDQSVACWTPPGLGLTPPTRLTSGARIYAAGSVLCRLDDAGALRCWGDATAGVLGTRSLRFNPEWVDGDAKGAFPIKRVPNQPIELGPGRRAVDIALSETHVCATLQDGGLLCWGRNQSGELGIGHSGDELCFSPDERDFRCRRVPPSATVDLKTQARIKKVAVAWQNTCVLFEDATLKCWGDNSFGQLGLGDSVGRDTPAAETVPY